MAVKYSLPYYRLLIGSTFTYLVGKVENEQYQS